MTPEKIKNLIEKGIKKGSDVLKQRQESIVSAAFIMMFLLVFTKIAGFLKAHLFARFFGTSPEMDVFWAAFTVPDIIFNVVVVGSINAALIPSFTEKLEKSKGIKICSKLGCPDSFVKLFSDILNLFLLIFVISGVLIFIFAPQLSRFLSGDYFKGFDIDTAGFSGNDFDLMAKIMRIMVISPILLSVSSVLTAGIQVNKRFIVPALAPLFYNLGIIFGTVVLGKFCNMGVVGIAWGVVIGSLLHLLIQLPLAYSMNLKFNLSFKFINKDMIKVMKLAFPRILGLIGDQVMLVINTIISLGLGEGSLSAYSFANNLQLLPVHLIGSTISQAALPTLAVEYSESLNGKDFSKFKETFTKTFQQILFLILPAVVFIVVLRLPFVRLTLGAGEFDWNATVVTAWVLALFGVSILFQSLTSLLLRTFYAMQNTVIPVIVSFIGLAINIICAFYLTNFFSHYYDWRPMIVALLDGNFFISGEAVSDLTNWFTTRNSSPAAIGGLALSTGIALIVETILLMTFLNAKLKYIKWNEFVKPILKKFFASGFMFFVMYFIYKLWNFSLDTSTVVSIFSLFTICGGIGVISYFIICSVIDINEIQFFINILKKFINKVRAVIGLQPK
ncbi:murein biosynthesis integral membrane protein MurJ [Candidatus Dojkabacteria bacterium]|nr:murein biosynthesis integral membrane protein MurJ [Candidatus Dojkabacteria bacterium]